MKFIILYYYFVYISLFKFFKLFIYFTKLLSNSLIYDIEIINLNISENEEYMI
jgi:hypothetical protein